MIKATYPDKAIYTEAQIQAWVEDVHYDRADSYRCSACGRDWFGSPCSGRLHGGVCEPVYEEDNPERTIPLTFEAQLSYLTRTCGVVWD